MTPEDGLTAMAGADKHSTFELGSISRALTGMMYRDALERGLVSPATTLCEVLRLEGHGKVGTVSVESLATPF